MLCHIAAVTRFGFVCISIPSSPIVSVYVHSLQQQLAYQTLIPARSSYNLTLNLDENFWYLKRCKKVGK